MIQIVFIGLIAFVHTPTNVAPLYALLPDATSPWLASDGQLVEDHIPFVAIKQTSLVSPGDCAHEANPPIFGTYYCIWQIDHEDVTFETIAAIDCENDDDAVSKMEAVTGRDGTLYPAKALLLDLKPDRDLLVGRVRLDVATLHSVEICEPVDSQGNRVDFQFKPILTPGVVATSQQVGEVARVVANPAGGAKTFTVRLKKYASMDQGRTIAVKGDSPTSVIIGNLANLHEMDCVPGQSPVPYDRHFEMFYRLAGEEPWRYDRPVPTACCKANPRLPQWFTDLLDADARRTLGLDLEPGRDRYRRFAIGARIVCPMASYQAPQ